MDPIKTKLTPFAALLEPGPLTDRGGAGHRKVTADLSSVGQVLPWTSVQLGGSALACLQGVSPVWGQSDAVIFYFSPKGHGYWNTFILITSLIAKRGWGQNHWRHLLITHRPPLTVKGNETFPGYIKGQQGGFSLPMIRRCKLVCPCGVSAVTG